MQFKLFSALFFVCLTAVVSAAPVPMAAPVPIAIPPLDVEARQATAREVVTEVARDASPEPICSKYACG